MSLARTGYTGSMHDGQQPNGSNRKPDEYRVAPQTATQAEYDDYNQHAAGYKRPVRHSVRKMFIVFGILVGLGLVSFIIYWFFLRDTGGSSTQNTQTTQTNSSQSSEAPTTTDITTKTEHYVSNTFMLEFDYPEDWTVAEQSESGQLAVQSPALQLEDVTGAMVTGQVVFTIRNKQQPLPEFDSGNAIAALESEKITYAKPSSVQRGSTYLSFLRYATVSQGLNGIYVTGDYGYQKDQAIPKADFTPVDPIISTTFQKCADGTCGTMGTAIGISENMWEETTFSKPLKAIFESLTIN